MFGSLHYEFSHLRPVWNPLSFPFAYKSLADDRRGQAAGWMVGIVLMVFFAATIYQQAQLMWKTLGVQMLVAVSGLLYTKVGAAAHVVTRAHGYSARPRSVE
jgi:hypothetical protein